MHLIGLFVLLAGLGQIQTRSITTALEGHVSDPSAALIAGANVTIIKAGGFTKTVSTTPDGHFRFDGLAPGKYTVRATASGFAQFELRDIEIVSGQTKTLTIPLQILRNTEKVTVSSSNTGVDVDPSRNGGQLVLQGSDLDAFSDDAEDLANELQALAGPPTGPEGPQIFVDGFVGGQIPPKASIREIRVNHNPFSSEYDHVGLDRIEIFTKPGTDKFHGQVSYNFGDRALTARNPYLTGPVVPAYLQELFAGNLSGPLSKKSSFFVDVDRRITNENSLFNYTSLDANFNPVTVNGVAVTPSRRFNISPRLDYALSANNTLTVRYTWLQNTAQNQGIGTQTFDLPSQGYSLNSTGQTVQVLDTAILGPSAVNDIRFQYQRTHSDQAGNSTAPELDVQGAFTGGGTFPLNYTDRNRYEFQNYTTVAHRTHTIRFGARLRGETLQEQNTSNFNGQFIFSALSGVPAIGIYSQNQLLASQGVPQAQIAAMGYGPSEFLLTTGQPAAAVSVVDAGLFLQDDWRVKPNLTLSGGLRFETQTGIADHANFAPRLGLAWAPNGKSGPSKTVIRLGAGIFYSRFTSDLLLRAHQQNGVNQTQYIVNNPTFFPNIPDAATLVAEESGNPIRTVYQIDPKLHVPYLIETAAGIERQLPHNITLALNYLRSRGLHELRARDINAPLPTVYNGKGQAAGPRPYGDAAGNIYQIEGSGVFDGQQAVFSVNARVNSRLTLFGYYAYNRAMSDTDGPGTFPANPYDLRSEYGRAATDARHRLFVSGTMSVPLGLKLAPFVFLQSGMPYNLTSGQDVNGDGNPDDDRPAFAQDLSRPSVVSKPGFGVFETLPAGLVNPVIVPRNYLQGPGIALVTIRISRTWTFGESGKGRGHTGADEIQGGAVLASGGLSSGSSRTGLASVTGGNATSKRYNLTASIIFRNLLNNVNPGTPIGNLSSPFFGKSVTLSTYGPLPGAGPNAGAGNRHIELQARFTF